METFYLNFAWWPAVYILGEYWSFWYLASVTIIIEMIALYYFVRFSWQQSLLASLTGNLISGTIGAFVMVGGMLVWHILFEITFHNLYSYSFHPIHWIASFILMCLGSVAIETLAIKLIFKKPFRKLFPALLIGNLLTYGFIAYVVYMNQYNRHQRLKVKYHEYHSYIPQQDTIRFDQDHILVFDTANVTVAYGKYDQVLHGYTLQIPYRIVPPFDSTDHQDFFLGSLDETPYDYDMNDTGRNNSHHKLYYLDVPRLKDTVQVEFSPKRGMMTALGDRFRKDTLLFIRYEPDYD